MTKYALLIALAFTPYLFGNDKPQEGWFQGGINKGLSGCIENTITKIYEATILKKLTKFIGIQDDKTVELAKKISQLKSTGASKKQIRKLMCKLNVMLAKQNKKDDKSKK